MMTWGGTILSSWPNEGTPYYNQPPWDEAQHLEDLLIDARLRFYPACQGDLEQLERLALAFSQGYDEGYGDGY